MDEPLGALDAEFRHLMCGELRDLHDRISATTVYVTHDQLEAMSMADRIAVMNVGGVEQIGTPQDVYDRPASMFVADFIGSPPMNFLHFEAGIQRATEPSSFATSASPYPRSTSSVPRTAGIGRASRAHPIFGRRTIRGRIFGAEYLGTTQIVTVDTEQGRVKARLASSAAVQIGETVGLAFRSACLALFDAQSGRAIQTASHGSSSYG